MRSYLDKNYILPVCKYRGTKNHIKFPCWVSLKKDGELQYIIKKGDKIFSVNKSKYGRYRFDYPALEEFKKLNLPDGIYLGELYWSEGRTKEDFYGLLRNKINDNLKIDIWGILQIEKNYPIDTEKTYRYLKWIKTKAQEYKFKYLNIVPFWFCRSWKELEDLIDKWIIKEKYEGLVVRNLDTYWREGSSVGFIKIKLKEREQNYKNSKYGIWI